MRKQEERELIDKGFEAISEYTEAYRKAAHKFRESGSTTQFAENLEVALVNLIRMSSMRLDVDSIAVVLAGKESLTVFAEIPPDADQDVISLLEEAVELIKIPHTHTAVKFDA